MGKLKKIIKIPVKGAYLGQLLLVVLALAVVVGAYAYLIKAEVTVFVEPKVLTNETEVIADPKVSSADFDKKIIPGSIEEVSVSGASKAPATGQKQIGDPARGKVIIYNKTDSAKSFSQGAVLTGPSGLKFTINDSVKISSQSAQTLPNGVQTTWGTSDLVGITALAIGPDSNLSAQTELTIGGLGKEQVVAQVKDALSGGTSKTITVVTADDQKKLQAQVVDDLRAQAQSKLQAKLPADKKIVAEALAVVDGQYNFNKKINDQSGELSLNATVKYKGTAYSDTDLKTIIAKLVETNVPDGFELDLKNSETQAEVSKVDKDGKLTFAARFKAKLLPKLNVDDLKKKIRGKNIDGLTAELKKIDNVLGSEIKFTPKLPAKLSRLPLLTRNISVIITPK